MEEDDLIARASEEVEKLDKWTAWVHDAIRTLLETARKNFASIRSFEADIDQLRQVVDRLEKRIVNLEKGSPF